MKEEFDVLCFSHDEQEYYLCLLEAKMLVEISYVARRGVDEEIGAVQRILNKSRISGIKDFLINGGFFPNNILLNMKEEGELAYNSEAGKLSFNPSSRIAQIIDGQHRVEGLKEAIKSDETIGGMLVPTVISNNLKTEDCAEIFLSINTEQKPVPKSLIYDLYGLMSTSARDFSIERGTDIAKILNTDDSSPYMGYIKFPGSRKFKGGIQLSSVVNSLKALVGNEGEFSKYSLGSLENQANALRNYFSAIQSNYGDSWDELTNPFLYSSGFSAAIEVFANKILPHCFAAKKFTETYFKELIVMPKDKLIKQAEVKNKSGEAAKDAIKQKLSEYLRVRNTTEEEFEF